MQIIADRRALHRIPELDRSLPKTTAYLEQALSGLSCRVLRPMEGAVAAWFDFGKPETVAFRADADALPIVEKTGAEYVSLHPGNMHACGHDGHMAILLELARRLDRKKTLPNNVLLIFQPAEETTGGARDLCETGILKEYGVKAIFGLHLWPGIESGTIASRCGELMARTSVLSVDIYGKSAHIAKADQGTDALAAGVTFYAKAMELEAKLPKEIFRLLKFGRFVSGTVNNALSAHTHMDGALRAYQDPVFEGLRQGLMDLAAEVEASYGCRIEMKFGDGYPAVINPEPLYEQVCRICPVQTIPAPFMTAEDFSWYQQYVPGVFFFLGLGNTPALHADTFDFDESLLPKGADFFEMLAEQFE